jgi:hypothetical protein
MNPRIYPPPRPRDERGRFMARRTIDHTLRVVGNALIVIALVYFGAHALAAFALCPGR